MQWGFSVGLGWEDRGDMDVHGTVDDDDGCLNEVKFSCLCSWLYLLLIKTKPTTCVSLCPHNYHGQCDLPVFICGHNFKYLNIPKKINDSHRADVYRNEWALTADLYAYVCRHLYESYKPITSFLVDKQQMSKPFCTSYLMEKLSAVNYINTNWQGI